MEDITKILIKFCEDKPEFEEICACLRGDSSNLPPGTYMCDLDAYNRLVNRFSEELMKAPAEMIPMVISAIESSKKPASNKPEWMNDSYWKDKFITDKDKKWRLHKGKFVDTTSPSETEKGDVFDLSPVCVEYTNLQGINNYNPNKDTFALSIGGLNNEGSHRIFPRVHYYDKDANLTLGFGHFAGGEIDEKKNIDITKGKVHKLCKELATKTKITKYIAYEISKNENFKLQIKHDVSTILNKTNTDNCAELEKNLNTFFKEEVSNDWAVQTILYYNEKASDDLKNTIKSRKEKFHITEETYYYIKGVKNKGEKTRVIRTIDDKHKPNKELTNVFFNGDDISNTTGFWFHDIMIKALTLKDVCKEQVSFWKKDIYDKAVTKAKEYECTEQDKDMIGVLCGWKSTRNFPIFNFTDPNNDNDNLGLKIENKIDNISINRKLYEDIKAAKALLLWVAYNKYKKKIRDRQKNIWNIMLAEKWGETWPGLDTNIIEIKQINNKQL